jgi:hypothetical protein
MPRNLMRSLREKRWSYIFAKQEYTSLKKAEPQKIKRNKSSITSSGYTDQLIMTYVVVNKMNDIFSNVAKGWISTKISSMNNLI